MKISVIVPVYNAEDKIKRAIDSILTQSYQNFELILINDGSTDHTLEICEQYDAQYDHVVLLNIENSGPGYARNVGLTYARGRYIAFVDADDVVHPNFLEQTINLALSRNLDIVTSNHYRVDEEAKVAETKLTTGVVDPAGNPIEQARYQQLKTSSVFGYVWGKLYKTSFIDRHNIRFSEEKQVFLEDTLFNLKAMAFEPVYYVVNEPLYYYNIYEDSLSQQTEDLTTRALALFEKYEAFLKRIGAFKENLDLFIPLMNRVIAWSLFQTLANEYSYQKTKEKVQCFSTHHTVRRLVNQPESQAEIKKIDSILQRLLYQFITWTMRKQADGLLALFFMMNYPMFSLYIQQTIRAS